MVRPPNRTTIIPHDKSLVKLPTRGNLYGALVELLGGRAVATFIWPADILHFYSIYITIKTFLLGVSERRL